jgi:hypothetical protein
MMHKYIKIFILLLFISAIADVITTTYIISNGGTELNPFMVDIVKDPFIFLIVKLCAMIGLTLGILIVFKEQHHWKMLYISFLIPICITLVAVFNNLYAIFFYHF